MKTENIVACNYVESNGSSFKAINPSLNLPISTPFFAADNDIISSAMDKAAAAFKVFKSINKDQKSNFLRSIANELELVSTALIDVAMQESGLTEVRLKGELARTTGQLRMFADLIEEGSWVDAVIMPAMPDRLPMPRADIRRMLRPLGPVVVFGASNFPLAFSVAGGDTAAAFAAGCPVIVKVHPAHPGTSAITATAIIKAVKNNHLPDGCFSMLYDGSYEVGTALVQHPHTKAVAFTGSLKGGMALHNLAQNRKDPIPVFAEMGSTNPIFVFPEAVINNAQSLSEKLAVSVTSGAGQFCTKPGLIFVMENINLDNFKNHLITAFQNCQPVTMLTPGICANYFEKQSNVLSENGVSLLYASHLDKSALPNGANPILAEVTAGNWLKNPSLAEEVFGPFSLLIIIKSIDELNAIVEKLEGQLTTTVISEAEDLAKYSAIIEDLTDKAGRLIFNGVPTGVEVNAAMNHGGPFPATNNNYTSVGSKSIYRFVRPIAYQDWPDHLLPMELKRENPYHITRQTNQTLSKD